MNTRLKIQVVYTTAATLYVVVVDRVTGEVWNPTLNTGAGGWEAYNSAHWAQYAIALTELTGSGFYQAAYPAGIADDVLTIEAFYQQGGGSPTLGDTPAAGLNPTQGQNIVGVAGDADVPLTLQANLAACLRGAAAGVPSVSVIPTDLTVAQSNALAGRSVVFLDGPAAFCPGRIVSYNPTNGVLTLAAPLPVAPEAADNFIVI
jgi:hypothetical protein